jgi:anti-sigma regulatory factor (Ser/Thr protein kinase)
MSLAARPEELPALLDFARGYGRQCRLPESALHRLLVILEELFLNTVHHGHGGGSEAPVTVELSLLADELRCSYTDGAPLFVPPAELPGHVGEAPEVRPVGGLGVALVRSLACSFSHSQAGAHGGNRIVFSLSLARG